MNPITLNIVSCRIIHKMRQCGKCQLNEHLHIILTKQSEILFTYQAFMMNYQQQNNQKLFLSLSNYLTVLGSQRQLS